MALRSTWSYAPTQSIDNAVACASASVINLTACPTQSVPALVDNANWNWEQTDSTVFPNCLAKVFAINLRKLVPVAIPRVPPSFFVIVADMNALHTDCGISVRAASSAARNINCRISGRSNERDRLRPNSTLANSISANFWMLNYGTTEGWSPEGWGAQNFALFFPPPATIFFLLSLSWGPFVEVWWCLKRRGPEMCTFGFLGLS